MCDQGKHLIGAGVHIVQRFRSSLWLEPWHRADMVLEELIVLHLELKAARRLDWFY